MKSKIYLQSEFLSDMILVEVDENANHETVRAACLAALPAEGRGGEILLFEEDVEGGPVQHGMGEFRKEHGVRLHAHRCLQVEVTVQFNGRVAKRKFAPSATIGRIKAWAGKDFGMSPEDIAEHVLQIAGTTIQPDPDQHVGVFAKHPQCAVTFDLVPAHRING